MTEIAFSDEFIAWITLSAKESGRTVAEEIEHLADIGRKKLRTDILNEMVAQNQAMDLYD